MTGSEIGFIITGSLLGLLTIVIALFFIVLCCWWRNAKKDVREPLQAFGDGAKQVLGAAYSYQCCTWHSEGTSVRDNTVRGCNVQGGVQGNARIVDDGDSEAPFPDRSDHGFTKISAQKYVDVIKRSITFGQGDNIIVRLLNADGITMERCRESCVPARASERESEDAKLPEIELHNGGGRVNVG